MRLTWKDGAATALAAIVVVLYGAYLAGAQLPLVSGPRALAGAVLVLGFVGCGLGGDAAQAATGRQRVLRYTIASVLGVTTLIAGLVALFSGNGLALAVLVAATVALWAEATAFHLFSGPPAARPVVDRETVGHRG
jgi:hypothetical protein